MQTSPSPGGALQVEWRLDGPAVIVSAVGEVDMDTAPILTEHITRAAGEATPPAPVVADLRGVQFFGSSGIAALLTAHHYCARRNTGLRVLATPLVTRPLEITGAHQVLTICPTLTAALGQD